MPVDLTYFDGPLTEAYQTTEFREARESLPAGVHQVFVESIPTIVDSPKLKWPGLSVRFLELRPTSPGARLRAVEMFQLLDPDPKRAGFLASALLVLFNGLRIPAGELEARLPELYERAYEVEVKRKKVEDREYTNVYLRRYLEGVQPPPADEMPF